MPPITWNSLNKRQQDYLAAIYQADQEVEARERSVSWHRGERSRPADQWRWMPYGSSLPSRLPMPVKKHLSWTEQISEGTSSTLEALEKRELIVMQHLSADELRHRGILSQWQGVLEPDPIPVIQITPAGRKMVRQALDLHMTRRVTGTLQEWHWRALAKAYEAGERGVPEEGLGYGRIGWKTWLRLRDYIIRGKEYPLIREHKGVSITAWGIGYYERTFARYQKLYPDVSAPAPAEQHDPLEPFLERVQGSQTCQACQGKYLIEITRTYQQQQKWTWSVQEHALRIAGEVTSRSHEIEQCRCQEGEIEEISLPLLALLDRFIAHGWQLHFPYHSWFHYLNSLMGGASDREKRWYDSALVREKLLPLVEDDDPQEQQRNVMKITLCYRYNERTGRGSLSAPEAPLGQLPLAITRKAGCENS